MKNLNSMYMEGMASVAIYLKQYQKYFDESLNSVKIDLGSVNQDTEAIKEIIAQLTSSKLYASTKEGDNMNESIAELKERTSSIDNVVRGLEKEVAVLHNTIDINFKNINASLAEIKQSISDIKSPVTSLNTQMVEVKKDIELIKAKQTDSVTNKKWLITTVIAALSLVGVVVKIFIG